MRVIYKGSQRVHCGRCSSLLEYEWSDIYTWDEGRGGSTITCPECKNLISVDPNIEISTNTTNTTALSGFDTFFRDSLCAANSITSSADTATISISNKQI